MKTVPFFVPEIGEEEIAAVTEVMRSGWITTGARAKQFEQDFQAYTSACHALAVSSGTAAIHLALRALGVGPGDEVITTPLTFCSTVHAIIETGATPVLADLGADLNLDPRAALAAVTSRTRALLPVHVAGLPCDMDGLRDVASRFGLKIVADAAHAFGAEYRGKPIGGNEADATAFSFYATKAITTAEGGMLTATSEAVAEKAALMRLHGIDRDAWTRRSDAGAWFYEVVEEGYKYNLPDVLAAIGAVQLGKAEELWRRRREIADEYNQAFRDIEELELPPERADSRHAWHLYILRLRLERLSLSRAGFIEALRQRGVNCSVHFIPIPLHRYFAGRVRLGQAEAPFGCERAMREYPRLVSLPLYPAMSIGDREHVIRAVTETVKAHSLRD